MYFDGTAFEEIYYVKPVDRVFGTTLAGRLNQLRFCRAFAEPNCNLVRHGRRTTSELGLSVKEKLFTQK